MLGLMFFSCKKAEELSEFDISYSTEFKIPAVNVQLEQPLDITTPELPSNSKSTFVKENTAAHLVDEIKITRMDFFIKNPATGNFDFLKNLKLFMSASGQPESQVAFKDSIPAGLDSLRMDLPDTDVKKFIFEEAFRIRTRVMPDGTLPADVTVKLEQTLHVKCKLFKSKKSIF